MRSDQNTDVGNFFSDNEIVYYSNLSNLSEKIQRFARDDKSRKKIAKNRYKDFFSQ